MNLLFETESKTVPITKEMVRSAYRKVKSNQGSAGVDRESLEEFQQNLSGNLYKIWNRLASGSYHPPPECSFFFQSMQFRLGLGGICNSTLLS
jgi:retron-type reverse transcriptase